MVEIPESHKHLLTDPIVAVFTTVSPDNAPENTIVWCSYDGEYVLVNTAAGRRKDRNIRNNPKVALLVLDPKDDFHWIDVRGVVEEIVPDDDYANINAHNKLYTGRDEFYSGASADKKGTEERVVYKIKPESIVAV